MNRKKILIITATMICCMICVVRAENLSMTTYFSPPAGGFDRLRLIPQAALSGSCEIGEIYVENSTGIKYCRDVSGTPAWSDISGVWTQNSNRIYLNDTLSNPDLKVGIGTNSPVFKLTVDGDDGAFLAKGGNVGAGTAMPSLGAGPRFVWYPRKAALRAGYVNGSQWDDGNIGDYSTNPGGYLDQVSGDYSSIGGGDVDLVTGDRSTILGGWNNTVSGNDSVAIGTRHNVAGDESVATGGYFMRINGDSSVGAGIGWFEMDGDYSVQMTGNSATFDAAYSVSQGISYVDVAGDYAVLLTTGNNVYHAAAIGNYSVVTSTHSEVSGEYSTATGGSSVNDISGDYATVVGGGHSTLSNDYTASLFGNTTISGYAAIAGGVRPITAADYSLVLGQEVSVPNTAQRSFIWGWAQAATAINPPADAFVLWDSDDAIKVGIKVLNPTHPLELASGARIQSDGNICTAANICLDTYSDQALKMDIKPLYNALDGLLRLKGVSFRWKDMEETKEKEAGMIAQDVEEIFPQWVSENADGYKVLNNTGYEAVYVEALREVNGKIKNHQDNYDQKFAELMKEANKIKRKQEKKIDQQQKKISRQEREIEKLKRRSENIPRS